MKIVYRRIHSLTGINITFVANDGIFLFLILGNVVQRVNYFRFPLNGLIYLIDVSIKSNSLRNYIREMLF